MKQPYTHIALRDCVAPAKRVNAALRGLILLTLSIFTLQSFATAQCHHSAPDATAAMAGCHDSAGKLEPLAVQHSSPSTAKADCCDKVCTMKACHFGSIAVNTFSLPFYSINTVKLLASVIELPSAPTHFIFRPPIFA